MKLLLRAAAVAFAAGFTASAVAQDQAATPPAETPTKVFAGAGLGGGFGARTKVNGQTSSFDDRFQGTTDKTSLVAVNVASFGIAFKPGLYAGIDLSGFAQSGRQPNGDKTTLQITNYFGALTYFPWETGLFLRAGAGLSSFVATTGSSSEHSGGLGILVAAGYALQLSGSHHLTLTVEQSWQSYGGSSATKPDSSQIGGVFLGYMWKP
ncbi:MAG TPA: hypothetical protein VFK92_11675 [Burkholderiales bacterium]|nr:hypothetical protein [Burkholderiales bacterium]